MLTESISTAQIEALQIEAGAHGDRDLVDTCARAIEGDTTARAKCAEVIAYAQAQHGYLYIVAWRVG